MSARDLELLRESARAALSRLCPPGQVRAQLATARGWDPEVWRRLCRELGVTGLMVPEALGGSGFSAVEMGVIFEEAGRALLCAPLLATAGLAVPLLLALDDTAACQRYLPSLCDGSLVATVVVSDAAGRPLPPGELPVAAAGEAGPALTGTAGFVVDGASAGLVLVPARDDDGLGVYAVEAGAPGAVFTALVTLDQTRRQAAAEFTAAPAVRIGAGDASTALAHALDVGRALLAAEQAGGAAACLDSAVSYGTTRIQFGRPIGSFQAVKQKCADLLIQVESARSAAQAAAQAAAAAAGHGAEAALPGVPDLPAAAAVAKIYCSDAFVNVAAENIQLHGGIGFTWEHDAQLYYKRAWTSRELLGRPEEHMERLATLLEEGATDEQYRDQHRR